MDNQVQAALVTRGLFICKFSIGGLNDGTYLPRITRETFTAPRDVYTYG